MLSKITGVARLTKEVEIRYSNSGTAVASLSLVNSNKRKNANGEQVEDVCFITATCFSRLAEIADQYLRKGSRIYFTGELKQDSWADKDGNKKSNHSIILDSFEMLGSKDQSTSQHQENDKQETAPIEVPEIDIDEDFIPF